MADGKLLRDLDWGGGLTEEGAGYWPDELLRRAAAEIRRLEKLLDEVADALDEVTS